MFPAKCWPHCPLIICKLQYCRSQWPCSLRRGSAAARLIESWVRNPPGAWMLVSCEFCVLLSGNGLCDEPIPRPAESYRLWCVSQCNQNKLQTSTLKRENRSRKKRTTKKKCSITTGKLKICASFVSYKNSYHYGVKDKTQIINQVRVFRKKCVACFKI